MAFWQKPDDPHHARFLDLCSLHVDGQLDGAAQRELDAHLAVCAACQARLEELRGLKRLVAVMPELRPRRSFAINPRLIARQDWLRRARWFTQGAVASGVAFGVIMGANFTWLSASTTPDDIMSRQLDAPRTGAVAVDSSANSAPPPMRGGLSTATGPNAEATNAVPANPPAFDRTVAQTSGWGFGAAALGLAGGAFWARRRATAD